MRTVFWGVLINVIALIFQPNLIAQSFSYDQVKVGHLSGKLTVRWLKPDLFLFIPNDEDPLTFTRNTGEKLTPGRMLTDGGSIPRPIWILRNYSPWGFAPAFIVHDWVFDLKHCKTKYSEHSLEDAGLIMAEIMKTMIEEKTVDAGSLTVTSMYLAVVSPVARKSWETGKCNPPPAGMYGQKPFSEYELDYSPPAKQEKNLDNQRHCGENYNSGNTNYVLALFQMESLDWLLDLEGSLWTNAPLFSQNRVAGPMFSERCPRRAHSFTG